MSQLVIRRGTEADIEVAAAVQQTSALVGFAHIFPPDAPKPTLVLLRSLWQDVLRSVPPSVMLVAEREHIVAGVAVAQVPMGPAPTGALSRVYVLPDHWAAGTGNQLLSAALDVLDQGGCSAATLWVLEHNHRARAWYERRGWQPTGEWRHPFPDLDVIELEYLHSFAGRASAGVRVGRWTDGPRQQRVTGDLLLDQQGQPDEQDDHGQQSDHDGRGQVAPDQP